jgi:hypothetical protein
MSTRITAFADGFTSASEPSVSGAVQENYILLNNQSLTDVVGLQFDSTSIKSVFFKYEIERIGSTSKKQVGTFQMAYNTSWELTFGNYQGDSIIEEALTEEYGITLSVTSLGQIQYSSNNFIGHISSEIKLYIVRILT